MERDLPLYKLDIKKARQNNEDIASKRILEKVHSVEDYLVPTLDGKVKIRIFTPEECDDALIIYLHGGDFSLNSINTHEFLMRKIANETNHKVLGVEYRLAPEYKFPVPLNDCIASIIWTYNNADNLMINKTKIYLGGDSTGGTLVLASALYLRDMNIHALKKIFMIYAPLDYYNPGTKSYFEKGYTYPVTRDFLIWGWDNYCGDNKNLDNEYLFPLRAKSFKGLPEILLMFGGLDALEDENKELAIKLTDERIPFEYKCYEDQMHGFMMNENGNAFKDAMDRIVKFTK